MSKFHSEHFQDESKEENSKSGIDDDHNPFKTLYLDSQRELEETKSKLDAEKQQNAKQQANLKKEMENIEKSFQQERETFQQKIFELKKKEQAFDEFLEINQQPTTVNLLIEKHDPSDNINNLSTELMKTKEVRDIELKLEESEKNLAQCKQSFETKTREFEQQLQQTDHEVKEKISALTIEKNGYSEKVKHLEAALKENKATIQQLENSQQTEIEKTKKLNEKISELQNLNEQFQAKIQKAEKFPIIKENEAQKNSQIEQLKIEFEDLKGKPRERHQHGKVEKGQTSLQFHFDVSGNGPIFAFLMGVLLTILLLGVLQDKEFILQKWLGYAFLSKPN